TIDRVAIYISAAAFVIATLGWGVSRTSGKGNGLWIAAILLSTTAAWHAASPGPTFDGWHGLGWRTIFDSTAPWLVRTSVAAAAGLIVAGVALSVLAQRAELAGAWRSCRAQRALPLFLVAIVLVMLRQIEFPGAEPQGYWPRWCFVWGLLAFTLGL